MIQPRWNRERYTCRSSQTEAEADKETRWDHWDVRNCAV